MYAVVNDVAAYPAFLPWCVGSEILSETDSEIVARLDLSSAGIRKSFTTRNRLFPPDRITLELVEGPFSKLTGSWRFTQLGDAGCKTEMVLEFDFAHRLLDVAFARVFQASADKLVDAFCRRADQLYG
jgi:ribosome-associated toxin RatA of RatAB toxin-antitoxin module